MTRVEFWHRLATLYPAELRHVLMHQPLADVFPLEEIEGRDECPLCGARGGDGVQHDPLCPRLLA